MHELARIIIILGVVLTIVGLGLLFADKIPGVGKLPGDIMVKKEGFSFYFPVTTCIIISVLLSLIVSFFNKG